MNSNLLFDFSVNKESNTIAVTREFAANLDLVWAAWTKPEILDQWWAPRPYLTQTKSMDFSAGGRWLYAMESPEGDKHWCRADYKSVEQLKSYSALDSFCDEDGNTQEPFPNSLWFNSFSEDNAITTVSIQIKYDSLESLEKIIGLGFKEGFTMAIGNLDEYLAVNSQSI